MSYKDKTDQEVDYKKLSLEELIAECKRQRKISEDTSKRDRVLVEIDERLKEIYLLFKRIKITENESSNNRRKVDKGI